MKNVVKGLSNVRALRIGFGILVLLFSLVVFFSLFSTSSSNTALPHILRSSSDAAQYSGYTSSLDLVDAFEELVEMTFTLEEKVKDITDLLHIHSIRGSLIYPDLLQKKTHILSSLHENIRIRESQGSDEIRENNRANTPPILPTRTSSNPFLLLAVPSLRRKTDDYLSTTLHTFLQQTSKKSVEADLIHGNDVANALHNLSIRVLICNNDKNERITINTKEQPHEILDPAGNSELGAASFHLPFYQNLKKYCGVVDETILKLGDKYASGFSSAFPDDTPHLEPCKKYSLGRHHVYFSPNRMILFAKNNDPVVVGEFQSGNANVPNSVVQQQSKDLSSMISIITGLLSDYSDIPFETALAQDTDLFSMVPHGMESLSDIRKVVQRFGARKHHVLLTEDDFSLCNDGLRELGTMITRANAMYDRDSPFADPSLKQPGWNGLRTSYGFNGVIMDGEDMPTLANYLVKHMKRRPPDHLLDEWMAGETPESYEHKNGRLHLASRRNLFSHLGKDSTLRGKINNNYAGCYHPMDPRIVFEIFVFNVNKCSHDVISPCWEPNDYRYSLPNFPLILPKQP